MGQMKKPTFKRTLNLTRTEYRDVLELARASSDASEADGRHEYPVSDIPLSVEQPQGGQSHYFVYGEWISASGMSVLTGRYVHPGSSCLLLLMRSSGDRMLVRGTVKNCRLVSGACHATEITLNEEIDPDVVEGAVSESTAKGGDTSGKTEALDGTILVVEPFVPDLLLLEHHLADLGPQIRLATTPGATLDAVKRQPVDLVLSGLNITTDDGIHTLERVRQLGCESPILLLTAETDPVALDRAHRAGANDVVNKPYNVDLLIAQLHVHLGGGEQPTRLISTIPRTPALSDLVERYVKFVRRTADQIHRTYQEQAWSDLRELCCQIKGSGVGYGFQHLTVSAISVMNALERGVDSPETKRAVSNLVASCRAVDFDAKCSHAA